MQIAKIRVSHKALLAIFIVTLLACRAAFKDFFSVETIAGIVCTLPFLHWLIIPYLRNEDMKMATCAFTLKSDEKPIQRTIFFILGSAIYVLALGL